jgi:hypothetical protein
VDFVIAFAYDIDPAMKLSTEKEAGRSRWSFETTGAVDRALAALILVVALLVAHLLGLDADLRRLFALSGL